MESGDFDLRSRAVLRSSIAECSMEPSEWSQDMMSLCPSLHLSACPLPADQHMWKKVAAPRHHAPPRNAFAGPQPALNCVTQFHPLHLSHGQRWTLDPSWTNQILPWEFGIRLISLGWFSPLQYDDDNNNNTSLGLYWNWIRESMPGLQPNTGHIASTQES